MVFESHDYNQTKQCPKEFKRKIDNFRYNTIKKIYERFGDIYHDDLSISCKESSNSVDSFYVNIVDTLNTVKYKIRVSGHPVNKRKVVMFRDAEESINIFDYDSFDEVYNAIISKIETALNIL